MHVSILVATYNRPQFLERACKSIFKQTHKDWDLTIIDDESDVPVDLHSDPRIRVVRNRVNQGREHGDIVHIRKFLDRYCEGEAFVYLCDDDYWIPDDLLARQVEFLETFPSVSFVLGGMAQNFPPPVFHPKTFPERMTGIEYIRLLADDPANRNIVSGACLFRRRDKLEHAKDVRWQAGYVLTIPPALNGNVVYIDEPCVMTAVDANSASYSGTQMGHMVDALHSVDAGFGFSRETALRNKMAQSIILIYVCNKIGFKLGYGFAVPNMDAQFNPPISSNQFLEVADRFKVQLSKKVKFLIECSDDDSTKSDWAWMMSLCKS